MRALGLLFCGLLLAACTSSIGGAARPEALTAAAALGDLRTVDYCTLLDTSGGTPVSSFEGCRVEVGGVRRTVGLIQTDDGAVGETYDYPGDLPPGMGVRERTPDPGGACTRWVGFSDHLWLLVGGVNAAAEATYEELCTVADGLVAGVVAAVEERRVGHVSYGPDSFGSIDPCTLLDVPEVAAVFGKDSPIPSPHGHDCLYGVVGLAFSVDEPSRGTVETLGGRQAVVDAVGAFCFVTVDRPLPDRPGLVEKAKLTGVALDGDGAGQCPDVRDVAEAVFPKLPR